MMGSHFWSYGLHLSTLVVTPGPAPCQEPRSLEQPMSLGLSSREYGLQGALGPH